MMWPCGGRVSTSNRLLKTRQSLLDRFPLATDHPLPAELTLSHCQACGRADKQLTAKRSDEKP